MKRVSSLVKESHLYYRDALESLGFESLLKSEEANWKLQLKKILPYALFYFSGNIQDTTILDYERKARYGPIADLGLLSNMDEVYDKLLKIASKKMNFEDVLDLKGILSKGIMPNINEARNVLVESSNKGKNTHIRKYPVLLADIYTADTTDRKLLAEIDKTVDMLNRVPKTAICGFLSAIGFHSSIEHLHPITNCNGRIGKTLTNFYLLKNGIKPIINTHENKNAYYASLDVFHISSYIGAFLSDSIISSFVCNENKIAQHIRDIPIKTEIELEIRDLISNDLGIIKTDRLRKDASILYNSRNKNSILAALWFLGSAKIDDSRILIKSIQSEDKSIRALSLFAMERNNFDKYRSYIKNAVFDDSNTDNRILAIGLLSRHNGLNGEILNLIVKKETDEKVLVTAVDILRYYSSNTRYMGAIEPLINSEIMNIKARAQSAAIIPASKQEVLNILNRLRSDSLALLEAIGICSFRRQDLFNSPDVARLFIDGAFKYPAIMDFLLHVLAKNAASSEISKEYIDLSKEILNAKGNSNSAEKANASAILRVHENFAKGPDFARRKLNGPCSNDIHRQAFKRKQLDIICIKKNKAKLLKE